jgi:hypothetical protein
MDVSVACYLLVSCLAYSWTLKIEVTFSSERSINVEWTTRRYILEVRTFHILDCHDLRYYEMLTYFLPEQIALQKDILKNVNLNLVFVICLLYETA